MESDGPKVKKIFKVIHVVCVFVSGMLLLIGLYFLLIYGMLYYIHWEKANGRRRFREYEQNLQKEEREKLNHQEGNPHVP